MPLAQMNIARLRHSKDDARVAEFMNGIDVVNRIARRSEGFLWLLEGEQGAGATGIAVTDDPRIIINMSVWRDAASLRHFVWNTLHERFFRRRAEWFEAWPGPHFVLWHVGAGHEPSVQEALERREHLERHGPSDHAFGWEWLKAAGQ